MPRNAILSDRAALAERFDQFTEISDVVDPTWWLEAACQCVDCACRNVPTEGFSWLSLLVDGQDVAVIRSGPAEVIIAILCHHEARSVEIWGNDVEAHVLIRARIEAWRITPAGDEIVEH
ncbi:hypothetical protein MMSR116_18340 [Methylobacterium mesophilicum SR1.6/6]|uniref:Uncharacterized protein n=1 Tax=Methylobacterium mesophilicum SR1.6/6 TaxID=908290 RepID=A0A6B9FM30_9HYPH|nr:hypothetical protein [Methylobacterium mesophilicum]QGY03630.1 hypothetical protein MMSR116_18340 [Methylobacterium mesophilicum SR1.6/6]